jgi:hypothetical protein
MSKVNDILIQLDETAMSYVQSIANVLDKPIEQIAEDALFAYVNAIDKRLKAETRKIFDNQY